MLKINSGWNNKLPVSEYKLLGVGFLYTPAGVFKDNNHTTLQKAVLYMYSIDTNWVHGNLNNFMNIYPILLKLSINEIQILDYNVDW